MSEAKQLDGSEVQNLKNIEKDYTEFTKRYGELRFQEIIIQREMSLLDKQFDKLENDRIAIMESLITKYGKGTVDIDQGIFIPDLENS